MDHIIKIVCSHGGRVNGLYYEGGETQFFTISRHITLENLRSFIAEHFSISYQFILKSVFGFTCLLIDGEEACSFILEINSQSPYISLYVSQVSSFANRGNDELISNYQHVNTGASSSSQPIAPLLDEHDDDDDDDDNDENNENSDDLIEDTSYLVDDDDVDNSNTYELFVGQTFDSRSKFRSFVSSLAIQHNFSCSASALNNSHGIIYTCDQQNCN